MTEQIISADFNVKAFDIRHFTYSSKWYLVGRNLKSISSSNKITVNQLLFKILPNHLLTIINNILSKT